jgi:tRNA threonylcarbamoyl adenosine modification protein YeaZ
MVHLAFDTCYSACSVAIGKGEVLLSHKREEEKNMHSRHLLAMIDVCLREAGLKGYEEVDRIIVSNGPGSFTGTRVGLAAAVGLKAALGIPVYSASTLSAIAQAFKRHSNGICLAQLEAGRGFFYQQLFQEGIAKGEIIHCNASQAAHNREMLKVPVIGDGEQVDICQLPDACFLLTAEMKLNEKIEARYC